MEIVSRGIKQDGIKEDDFQIFLNGLKKFESRINSGFIHRFEDHEKSHKIIETLTGDTSLINWRRKLNNLPFIILADYKDKPVDMGVYDSLGFFFNTTDLKRDLNILGCDYSTPEIKRESFNKVYSVIVLNRGAITRFCNNNSLEPEMVYYMVLAHEVGHLVFNPILHSSIPDNYGLEGEIPDLDTKLSPIYRSLVEGSAQWFSLYFDSWDKEYKKHLFTTDPDSPYSYYLELDMFQPNQLYIILLSLYFNLVISALGSIPYNNKLYYKSINRWSSLTAYILNGFNGSKKLTVKEFKYISLLTEDLMPVRYIESMGQLFIKKPDFKSDYSRGFDDYLITDQTRLKAEMWYGILPYGMDFHLLGMTSDIREIQKASVQSVIFDNSMNLKDIILNDTSETWRVDVGRRALFSTWSSCCG